MYEQIPAGKNMNFLIPAPISLSLLKQRFVCDQMGSGSFEHRPTLNPPPPVIVYKGEQAAFWGGPAELVGVETSAKPSAQFILRGPERQSKRQNSVTRCGAPARASICTGCRTSIFLQVPMVSGLYGQMGNLNLYGPPLLMLPFCTVSPFVGRQG